MAVTREQHVHYQQLALEYLNRAGIILTPEEQTRIEIADLGLEIYEEIGLALFTYINTDRVCAKELVLLPHQTCPEHLHPPIPSINYPGKEETFRCRWGEVYLYVSGDPVATPAAIIPPSRPQTFTVFHEIILRPGDQYTIMPETWHWFQGGSQGAVVSEFSTKSIDEADLFTDPQIRRIPEIKP